MSNDFRLRLGALACGRYGPGAASRPMRVQGDDFDQILDHDDMIREHHQTATAMPENAPAEAPQAQGDDGANGLPSAPARDHAAGAAMSPQTGQARPPRAGRRGAPPDPDEKGAVTAGGDQGVRAMFPFPSYDEVLPPGTDGQIATHGDTRTAPPGGADGSVAGRDGTAAGSPDMLAVQPAFLGIARSETDVWRNASDPGLDPLPRPSPVPPPRHGPRADWRHRAPRSRVFDRPVRNRPRRCGRRWGGDRIAIHHRGAARA